MTRLSLAGPALLLALTVATPAFADAKGKVALKGATFTVADAVAYKTRDGVEVAFLPKPFDRKAAAKDLTIDSFDLMRAGGARVALKVGPDGSFNCIDYATGEGGGSTCDSDYTKALTLTTRTADRIAGTFRLNAGGDTVDVTFDLPVESTVARGGTALPADGGEPGKAVLAHFAAIEKNDFKALKATAAPDRREMMDEAEKSGEAKELFKMMRSMSPRKVKLTGGTVDGDSAMVDFEGVADGAVVKGVAECERIGGAWYMSGTSIRR